jgi:hypothetical protein
MGYFILLNISDEGGMKSQSVASIPAGLLVGFTVQMTLCQFHCSIAFTILTVTIDSALGIGGKL